MGRHLVLGLGGTVDHELWWEPTIVQGLVDSWGVSSADLEHGESLTTRRDALVALVRFIAHGSGGERYVADREELLAFSAGFRHTVTLGGTPVRAAICLARTGFSSTVHLTSTSEEVRRLLPREVSAVSSAQRDSVDPHVIVQYPEGAGVRLVDGAEVRSRRPNRVILVNDEPNELMRLSPDLRAELAQASAFLISGFNTMKSASLLEDRLNELREMMGALPAGTPVVYEDAGFHDPRLRAVILEAMPCLAAVHSMNEDEAQEYLGRDVDLEDAESVAAMMRDLCGLIGSATVVVHTARFAAVAGADAAHLRAAAEQGCAMAGTRFAVGDSMTVADLARVTAGPRDPIGCALAAAPAVQRSGVLIAPSFDVRTAAPTTIGLGDSFVGGVMRALAESGRPAPQR